jgi:hypothetical protein
MSSNTPGFAGGPEGYYYPDKTVLTPKTLKEKL